MHPLFPKYIIFFVMAALVFVLGSNGLTHAQELPPAQDPYEVNSAGIPSTIVTACEADYETRKLECDYYEDSSVPDERLKDACRKAMIEQCYTIQTQAQEVIDRTAISQSRAQQSVQQKVAELNKTGLTSITKFFGRSIGVIMGVMGTVALVMFMYGGILWMTSAGNSEKAGQAIQILVWTSLGIVVILTSYTVVDFFFQSFS